MQRAGLPTAYAGFIGEDEEGQLIVRSLGQQGVDISHVRTIPGQTGKTHILLTPQGERQFLFEHLGPVFPLPVEEEVLTFALKHELIHSTFNGGAQLYLPEIKKHPDILVSMDYGERFTQEFIDETIAFIDLAFFSLPENYQGSARDFASQMFRPHLSLLLVTLGKDGSLAYNGSFYSQPAVPVNVLDSLGAGDSYIGTFLANWLQEQTIQKSMEQASQAAAWSCTFMGAWKQEQV
jgi:fructoselysine 6-kinase